MPVNTIIGLKFKKYNNMKNLILLVVMLNSFQHLTLAQNPKTDSLIKLLKTAKQDTSHVNYLNALSWEYLITGDYELTISYSEKAEALAKLIRFKKGMAKAINNQGIVYYYQGNYPKALDYYLRAYKIMEVIGDKKGIANSLNNIGNIYDSQGDYTKALEYYFRSLKIMEEIGVKKGISACLNNIGLIYMKQDKNPKALDYQLRSLKINEEIGDKKAIAGSLVNIGVIYDSQGDYPKALDFQLRSLKIQEEVRDKNGIALSLNNLGNTYLKTGNTSLAIDYGIKGLAIAQEIEALDLIKGANEVLSKAYQKNYQHQKALEYYKAFVAARDSLFNEDNTKNLVQSELKFDYEKKEQAAKLEQEKKDAIALEEQEKQKVIRNSFMGGFALLLLLSLVIFRSYRNKKRANELISRQKHEVEQQKHTIEEKQKDILDSIHYAKRIQDALLKEEQHVSNHLPEHFVLFKPKDIISGDFYWALEKQGHLYLAIADCTGHGVPGAMMSMLGIAFLNEITGVEKLQTPAEILDQLRIKIIKDLKSKDGITKDGMDISLIRLNLKTLQLEWAGANNPLWYLSLNELKEIKADKQPIGFHHNPTPFTNHSFQFQKEDTIYLFTDGYADQFGGKQGKKFKYAKLKELLLSVQPKNMNEQKEILDESFTAWRGNLEQVDDVCVIGIKI